MGFRLARPLRILGADGFQGRTTNDDRLGLRVFGDTAEPFLLVDEIVQHRGEFANCAVQFRQNPPLIR